MVGSRTNVWCLTSNIPDCLVLVSVVIVFTLKVRPEEHLRLLCGRGGGGTGHGWMDERIVAVAVAPRATVAALYIAQRLAIVIAYSAIVIQTNFRGYSGEPPIPTHLLVPPSFQLLYMQ